MESKHGFRVMHRHSPVWMMSVNNTGLYIYFHVFHCRPLTLFDACKGEWPSFLASVILCILSVLSPFNETMYYYSSKPETYYLTSKLSFFSRLKYFLSNINFLAYKFEGTINTFSKCCMRDFSWGETNSYAPNQSKLELTTEPSMLSTEIYLVEPMDFIGLFTYINTGLELVTSLLKVAITKLQGSIKYSI